MSNKNLESRIIDAAKQLLEQEVELKDISSRRISKLDTIGVSHTTVSKYLTPWVSAQHELQRKEHSHPMNVATPICNAIEDEIVKRTALLRKIDSDETNSLKIELSELHQTFEELNAQHQQSKAELSKVSAENVSLITENEQLEIQRDAINAKYNELAIQLNHSIEKGHLHVAHSLSKLDTQYRDFKETLKRETDERLEQMASSHHLELAQLNSTIDERDEQLQEQTKRIDELQLKGDKYNSMYASYKVTYKENSDLKAIQELHQQKIDLFSKHIKQLTEDNKQAHAKCEQLMILLDKRSRVELS